MHKEIDELLQEAIWTAQQLFAKGLVTGSTGNISFLHDDIMYISKSGSCFGRMDSDSFAQVSLSNKILKGRPSKEYPLHLALYKRNSHTQAVVHTHSFYSTALSCALHKQDAIQQLFAYTPYLNILTNGRIGCIPYHPPGSEELFASFKERVDDRDVYLLSNHGLVVGAEGLYRAFDIIEEFEVSAKMQILVNGCQLEALRK